MVTLKLGPEGAFIISMALLKTEHQLNDIWQDEKEKITPDMPKIERIKTKLGLVLNIQEQLKESR